MFNSFHLQSECCPNYIILIPPLSCFDRSVVSIIPLLTEVFEVMDGKAPMIIELKTGPRNRELCEKALRLMRSYPGKFCIESFDPRIVRWFWKNAPDILRGQLAALPESYTGEPKIGRFILGHVLSNFWCRPQFIAYDNVKKPLSVRAAEARGAPRPPQKGSRRESGTGGTGGNHPREGGTGRTSFRKNGADAAVGDPSGKG